MKVGYKTQHLPIYVIQDLYSSWGYELGLQSDIPTMLQVGLIGYLFIIPDILADNCVQKKRLARKGALYAGYIFLPTVFNISLRF